MIHPDGRARWISSRGRLIRDADGRPLRLIGTNLDVTERRRTEEALASLNASLETRVAERSAVAEERARDLRRLAAELCDAEDRERRRVARLLHDDVQQLLLAIKLRLNGLLRSGIHGGHPERLLESLEPVEGWVEDAMEMVRGLSHELSPTVLQSGTMVDALEWLAEWFGERHGLAARVSVDGEVPPLPETLRIFLFRAVRELLTNVVKHTEETKARIRLSATATRVTLEVADGARGFEPASVAAALDHPTGFGLFNIRERLESLEGWLEILRSPEGGACFRLVLPVDTLRPGSRRVRAAEPDEGDRCHESRGSLPRNPS
jgi:signal transduction histidine kinase